MNLLRKTQMKFECKETPGNRMFWKEIRPYFSDKGNMFSKIMFAVKDIIVRKDKIVAKFMNNCLLT